jgi:hypothetical protein
VSRGHSNFLCIIGTHPLRILILSVLRILHGHIWLGILFPSNSSVTVFFCFYTYDVLTLLSLLFSTFGFCDFQFILLGQLIFTFPLQLYTAAGTTAVALSMLP